MILSTLSTNGCDEQVVLAMSPRSMLSEHRLSANEDTEGHTHNEVVKECRVYLLAIYMYCIVDQPLLQQPQC